MQYFVNAFSIFNLDLHCQDVTSKRPTKEQNSKPLTVLSSFSHWHVQGFYFTKSRALKVDVIGPENILFAGASVHLSARKLHAGAVVGLIIYCSVGELTTKE